MARLIRTRPGEIWTAFAVASLLTLVLAGTVAAKGPAVAHRVSAGGPDICEAIGLKPGCDANFSLVATQFVDGSGSGQYTDRFGRVGGFKGVIDCVVVDGNRAWVSGWIKSGRFEHDDLSGLPFTALLVDNGTSASDPPDQISTSNTGDPTPCSDMVEWELHDAPQGQVKIS